ncbi:ABC transporter permease [Fictibacillus barbaricus]|uniref:ABC-2 type transport system permease protein n=1 Tax=Fictibacillus barbaricus TaxID=182136 RepID=A0ABU1U1P6_9BACL|nr:ABC transporter permease [Fictibacillus barbaricus]MDR7073403.1 ABC-2 type transport system permease protein [Fictibacillus barbaricus]
MVWTIAFTRIKLLLQSPWSWLGLVIPVLLLGFLDLSVEKTAQNSKIPVVIVDEDVSDYSKLVLDRVRKNPAISVKTVSRSEAKNQIKTQEASIGFLIPEGFMKHIQENEENELVTMWLSTGSISHGLVREIFASEVKRLSANSYGASTVIKTYGKSENAAEQKTVWKEAWEYSDHQWKPEPLMTINYKVGATKEKAQPVQERNLSIYVPGMLLLLMLFSFLWNSWPIKDREAGMRFRVPYSARSSFVYWSGNALGVWILQLQLLVLLVAFGWWKGELAVNSATVASLLGYVLFLNALSLLFAYFVSANRTWQAITLFTVLSTSLLSGTFFPSDELTRFLEKAAQWTPQYWVMAALHQDTMLIPLTFLGLSIVLFGLSTIKAGDNA